MKVKVYETLSTYKTSYKSGGAEQHTLKGERFAGEK